MFHEKKKLIKSTSKLIFVLFSEYYGICLELIIFMIKPSQKYRKSLPIKFVIQYLKNKPAWRLALLPYLKWQWRRGSNLFHSHPLFPLFISFHCHLPQIPLLHFNPPPLTQISNSKWLLLLLFLLLLMAKSSIHISTSGHLQKR